MPRTMYDACSYLRIPPGAAMVAGYVSGQCRWPGGAWTAFPDAVMVPICTNPALQLGVVLDVENGDATPTDAPGWCERRRAAGIDPTVYCSASTWPAVRAAFGVQRVRLPHFWIADWSHGAVIPAGAVACQYADETARGYDVSIVAAYWPGIDPAPAPPPADPEEPMLYVFTARTKANAPGNPNSLADCLSENLMSFRWIQNPQQMADIQSLAKGAGVPLIMHEIGQPVADVGAFGVCADALTASEIEGAVFP